MNNESKYFIYTPPENSEPLMQNVTLGYKFANGHWERSGKRNIKIKRFGKSKIKRITKKVWSTSYILNNKWMLNLKVIKGE